MPAMPHSSQAGKNAPNRSKEGAPVVSWNIPQKMIKTKDNEASCSGNGAALLCIYRRRSKFPAEVLDDLENFDATSLFQLCFREANANLFKGNTSLYKTPRKLSCLLNRRRRWFT
jgi:hypothetical protein